MPDFKNLASQLSKYNPTPVNADSYNPTNTALQACPPTNSDWEAVASPLPPSPNQELCSCMYSSLSCVPKTDVDPKDYGDLFSYICGHDKGACAGINRNFTMGDYGAYGMCNSTEQLGWAMNQYASGQSGNGNGCDFSGSATSQQAAATPAGGCSALLQQAGTGGTGTVTSSPTSGGGAAATSSGAGNAMLRIPSFDFGLLQMGIYVACAGISGAAMILL
jgi:1,3-beta-glucanosyltransferase GAS1